VLGVRPVGRAAVVLAAAALLPVALLIVAGLWGPGGYRGRRGSPKGRASYSLALIVELAAFVRLRLAEPGLARPWRVPGGLGGALVVAGCPACSPWPPW
jgi:hypothetical protein